METKKIALEILKSFIVWGQSQVRGRARWGLQAHRAEQLADGSALVLMRTSMGGWWSHSRPADLPVSWAFLQVLGWCSTNPELPSCWGPQLSPKPKAWGMTPYHWALLINQQTNYHSQSRLSAAFLSGRVKAEKRDLVCSEYELFPTLPATRRHWRRF